MSNKFWNLTPRDTNPIEGSHAQDNQVNKANRTLLEAILGARQLDSDNARIIKASVVEVPIGTLIADTDQGIVRELLIMC
ncbi:hypothetical protein B0H14DRAFT_2874161 [Mycena olivaceomarginata]|nr:hypothetical protein B0H14DRAFT_2874161 [Mycena olivaceomarginata]